MYGIHEVSIAKAALAWIVVFLYAFHLGVLGERIGRGREGSQAEEEIHGKADILDEMEMEEGKRRKFAA